MSETLFYPSTTTIVTDTISTGNVSVNNDLLDQWAYLTPSTANSSRIIAGLTRLANTYINNQGLVFWGNTTSYSTIAIAWTLGTANRSYSGLLIPDGRVIFPPGDGQANIGIFSPKTNTFTSVAAAAGYWGGILSRDGRVVFAPYTATNVGVFNPANNVFTTYSSLAAGLTGSSTFTGGVVAPDGRIIFTPHSATYVGTFNPATNSFTSYAVGGPQGSFAYYGSVLVPDGRVVCVPGNAQNVGVFNPATNSFTTYTGLAIPPGTNAHYGGALAPDGRVIFTPSNTANVGIFNPVTNQYSSIAISANPSYNVIGTLALPGGRIMFISRNSASVMIFNPVTNTVSTTNMVATADCTGGVLLPDGRIVIGPQNTANTLAVISGGPPAPPEFCLHPFFNKY